LHRPLTRRTNRNRKEEETRQREKKNNKHTDEEGNKESKNQGVDEKQKQRGDTLASHHLRLQQHLNQVSLLSPPAL